MIRVKVANPGGYPRRYGDYYIVDTRPGGGVVAGPFSPVSKADEAFDRRGYSHRTHQVIGGSFLNDDAFRDYHAPREHNPKKKSSRGQRKATAMAKKRRKSQKKRNPAHKRARRRSHKRNPAHRAHSHAHTSHKPKRRRARKNPAHAKRRHHKRRRNPSLQPLLMQAAKGLAGALIGGTAAIVIPILTGKASSAPVVYGTAAAGVVAGALVAKKYPAIGLGIAAGSGSAVAVPMLATKVMNAIGPVAGTTTTTTPPSTVGAVRAFQMGAVNAFGGMGQVRGLAGVRGVRGIGAVMGYPARDPAFV